MIEHLFKKKMIRDFLKKYSTNQWPQVISDVFEIGILNLQNSFHTMYFTKETFQNIINDLKSQLNLSAIPNDIKVKDNTSASKFNRPVQTAFKPSKNWRSGDPPEYKTDYVQDTRNAYNQIREDDGYYSEEQKRRKKRNKKKNKHIKGEVYVSKDKEIQQRSRSNSRSRPKIDYRVDLDEIKEKNRENSQRVQSIESKIKDEIYNDRTTYQFIKNQTTKSKGNMNIDQDIENTKDNKQENYNKVNYAISYDKQLKPESIQKKRKEKNQVVYCKKGSRDGNRKERKTQNMNQVSEEEYRESNDNNQETNLKDSEGYDPSQMQQMEYNEYNDDGQNSKKEQIQENIQEHTNNSENKINQDQQFNGIKGKQLLDIQSIESHNEEKEVQTDENMQLETSNNADNNNNSNDNKQRQNYNNNYSNNNRNNNIPLYYENNQNAYSRYQSSQYDNTNNHLENNANLSNNYENNDYQPLSNSQQSQERGEASRDEDKSNYKNYSYDEAYNSPSINELVNEPKFNHPVNNELRYRNYQHQPMEERGDYYSQFSNNQTYQYNPPDNHVPNTQFNRQYSNKRDSNIYINRHHHHHQQQLQPQYQSHNLNQRNNNNEQMDQQYIKPNQFNSNEISFKQSNQDSNNDNQLNEGQLSMLNLSDRTKHLFRRELNHWNSQEREQEDSNNANNNNDYLKNRYVYQMESCPNEKLI